VFVIRTFVLLSVVAALASGAYVLVEGSGLRELDGGSRVENAEGRAATGVAAANLQAAAVGLETARAATGTYANAPLAIAGVRLVRADATSYCVEAVAGSLTMHLRGPNGGAALGPCR
jgi:hypothetical protein